MTQSLMQGETMRGMGRGSGKGGNPDQEGDCGDLLAGAERVAGLSADLLRR